MNLIQQAVQSLAKVCDYAKEQDGSGFNGVDARFGHLLANTPYEQWKPRWESQAYKMLKKYRKQLAKYGIDYDKIEKPKFVEVFNKHIDQPSKAWISDDYIFFKINYNVLFIERMKKNHARWSPKDKTWYMQINSDNAQAIIKILQEFDFNYPENIIEYLNNISTKQEKEVIVIPELKKQLKPFQIAGVEYICNKERVLFADEMGLGKTAQSIAAICTLNAFPCLVVCPASVKLNWQKEIEEWTDHSTQVLYSEKTYKNVDFTIVNYDMLTKHLDYLNDKPQKFKSIIIDESHYCKNSKAQRTKWIKTISKDIPYRIMLTGTPCLNRPIELAAQLDILGQLKNIGGFWHFANRYCGAYHNGFGWDFTGATNKEELHQLLKKYCFIRRTKAEVLTELPSKSREIVLMEIENRKEYNLAHRDIKAWFQQHDVDFSMKAIHLTRIEKLKQLAINGKLNSVIEWVENFLESGEKLVLFASHIETQKKLIQYFKGCASILGEHTAEQRKDAINRFQSDPKCNLIICSLNAAGIGVTLTAASNVAFCELGWTPGIMAQAEDRVHRIGQHHPVTTWYLIAKDTIEEEIYNLIEHKRVNTDIIHDGHTSVITNLIQGWRD